MWVYGAKERKSCQLKYKFQEGSRLERLSHSKALKTVGVKEIPKSVRLRTALRNMFKVSIKSSDIEFGKDLFSKATIKYLLNNEIRGRLVFEILLTNNENNQYQILKSIERKVKFENRKGK